MLILGKFVAFFGMGPFFVLKGCLKFPRILEACLFGVSIVYKYSRCSVLVQDNVIVIDYSVFHVAA